MFITREHSSIYLEEIQIKNKFKYLQAVIAINGTIKDVENGIRKSSDQGFKRCDVDKIFKNKLRKYIMWKEMVHNKNFENHKVIWYGLAKRIVTDRCPKKILERIKPGKRRNERCVQRIKSGTFCSFRQIRFCKYLYISINNISIILSSYTCV